MGRCLGVGDRRGPRARRLSRLRRRRRRRPSRSRGVAREGRRAVAVHGGPLAEAPAAAEVLLAGCRMPRVTVTGGAERAAAAVAAEMVGGRTQIASNPCPSRRRAAGAGQACTAVDRRNCSVLSSLSGLRRQAGRRHRAAGATEGMGGWDASGEADAEAGPDTEARAFDQAAAVGAGSAGSLQGGCRDGSHGSAFTRATRRTLKSGVFKCLQTSKSAAKTRRIQKGNSVTNRFQSSPDRINQGAKI